MNGRQGKRKAANGRDGGTFTALPHVVIDSVGYRATGHVARSLLIDIARQHNRRNNGELVACMKYLRPLGWKSHDVVTRALRELVANGLLIETRKGARPSKAAWFALAWQQLDVTIGLDIDPKKYRTGGYVRHVAKNAALVPSDGIERAKTAPSHGIGAAPSIPSHGAVGLNSRARLSRLAGTI